MMRESIKEEPRITNARFHSDMNLEIWDRVELFEF